MEYRKLGKTDIDVSVIALGCWPFGGGRTWGDQDDQASIATVHAALDAGVTLFDTAPAYERSESVLGEALEGRRQEALIATKVGGKAPTLEDSCDQSLKNLRTDVIDLYQIHWPSRKKPLDETVTELQRLVKKGKVRTVGVCNFGVGDLSDFLALGDCATDQLSYSLVWRVIEREIKPMCVEKEVGIICYSPLFQGLLTGCYASPDEVPEGRSRSRLYSSSRLGSGHSDPGVEKEAFTTVDQVRRISKGLGESMPAVSLAWVRQQPGVSTMLVGARTPEEIAENARSVELTLSPETVGELTEASDETKEKLGTNPDMWMSDARMR